MRKKEEVLPVKWSPKDLKGHSLTTIVTSTYRFRRLFLSVTVAHYYFTETYAMMISEVKALEAAADRDFSGLGDMDRKGSQGRREGVTIHWPTTTPCRWWSFPLFLLHTAILSCLSKATPAAATTTSSELRHTHTCTTVQRLLHEKGEQWQDKCVSSLERTSSHK